MNKPTGCTACGNSGSKAFKKGVRTAPPLRDGSRYWKCEKCGHGVETTAEGYILDDPLPMQMDPAVPDAFPKTQAMIERQLLERLSASLTPSDALMAAAKRAVASQKEFNGRLNSSDPKVRSAAEAEARRAAMDFLMDDRLGGP